MNCKQVKKKIDFFLIEKKGALTKKASHHISECPSCREHYELTLQASKLTDKLRSTEPIIPNLSKLTEDIMMGISQVDQQKSSPISISIFNSINLQRLLAAASICLLLVFGYEQYRVLSKLNHLEIHNQKIGNSLQANNSNLKGTLEGFLIINFKIQNKNPEKLLKNLSLEHYSTQELLAAVMQVKQGNFSSKELNQFLGTSFSSVEANNLIEKIKSYDIETLNSKNFINN